MMILPIVQCASCEHGYRQEHFASFRCPQCNCSQAYSVPTHVCFHLVDGAGCGICGNPDLARAQQITNEEKCELLKRMFTMGPSPPPSLRARMRYRWEELTYRVRGAFKVLRGTAYWN